MNGFLLDTNVMSELVQPRPAPNVTRWISEVDEVIVFLSVLTIGEIRSGIERLTIGRRRGQLESWLNVELRDRFASRILPVDHRIAERWGKLTALSALDGRPLPVIDGLLAATAIEHDLMLVTRNEADVAATGAATLNPWR